MPALVLGPILRHVNATAATVWVETDMPCTVTIAGRSANTFSVSGHHYALVVLDGLEPATTTAYEVHLDGERRWPLDAGRPPSLIRTLPGDASEFVLVFGSCRMPATDDPAESRKWGTDALAAYAERTARRSESAWPRALVLLGDQIYADETSRAMRAWIAGRRDPAVPPGIEVANFEEYAHLYLEAWSAPPIRWLMSTVPTSMIFDDHDVRDDWNTSQSWREDMARTSWWAERRRGALASYWIYQHIGNLSPADLAEDKVYRRVTETGRTGDAAAVLREFAEDADREVNGRKGSRWSYRRDFGRVRLLMVDTRSGRILAGGRRSMLSDGEFAWVEDNTGGDFDHLLIGSSLPWLMPHAIAHVQTLNEASARRPGWRGRLAERVRRLGDLEHWPAFRESFDRFTGIIRRAAETTASTVCVLSGDVHHVYTAEAVFDRPVNARVHQLTCSPLHNSVPGWMRPLFRLGWFRPLSAVLGAWGRWVRRIAPPAVRWRKIDGPHFGNTVAELRVQGRRAEVVYEHADEGPDGPRLRVLSYIPLSGGDRGIIPE